MADVQAWAEDSRERRRCSPSALGPAVRADTDGPMSNQESARPPEGAEEKGSSDPVATCSVD